MGPSSEILNSFDDIKIPEPSTLFDDYGNRGIAAKNQDMTILKCDPRS